MTRIDDLRPGVPPASSVMPTFDAVELASIGRSFYLRPGFIEGMVLGNFGVLGRPVAGMRLDRAAQVSDLHKTGAIGMPADDSSSDVTARSLGHSISTALGIRVIVLKTDNVASGPAANAGIGTIGTPANEIRYRQYDYYVDPSQRERVRQFMSSPESQENLREELTTALAAALGSAAAERIANSILSSLSRLIPRPAY